MKKIPKKEIIFFVFKLLTIILLIFLIFNAIKDSKKYFTSQNNLNENFSNFNEKVFKDFSLYNKILSDYQTNLINIEKFSTPYIPERFSYVTGTWDSGFVIEDEQKNQFVWIPCSINENEKTAFLNKYDFNTNSFIKKSECSETYENIENFFKSTFENGGFYIARFETGIENKIPVIKKDIPVYSNITYEKALEISNNFYSDNTTINSCLLNSYAYDTAYNWIISTNNMNITNNKRENIISGNTSFNNIYDLCDTVWEWSTETFYENMVARGISGSEYYSKQYSMGNRYALSNDTTLDTVGFRIILYK